MSSPPRDVARFLVSRISVRSVFLRLRGAIFVFQDDALFCRYLRFFVLGRSWGDPRGLSALARHILARDALAGDAPVGDVLAGDVLAGDVLAGDVLGGDVLAG